MAPFTIEIAGHSIRVQPLFASTREYCKKYWTDREPEFFVEVTDEDLVHSQLLLVAEAIEEGIKVRKFPQPFLERYTIQRKVARELLNRDVLLLHGSTVGLDGHAFLFTAPCGTGKSTHTRLWREVFGERAVMVNDDKPFLKISDDEVVAFGSPWSGKHGLDSNIALPLKGICFLRRGAENRIRPADPAEFLCELVHQSFAPEDLEGRDKVAFLVNRLSQMVSLWQMDCTKQPTAALVSYEAMSG